MKYDALVFDENANIVEERSFNTKEEAGEWFRQSAGEIMTGDGDWREPDEDIVECFLDFDTFTYEFDMMVDEDSEETVPAVREWMLCPAD